MFWPREIWSKYVNKLEVHRCLPLKTKAHFQMSSWLENVYFRWISCWKCLNSVHRYCSQDLKSEENSVKAVQCLNDMVTNALLHVEDCLKYMSDLKDPAIFRFCAIPQVYLYMQCFTYTGILDFHWRYIWFLLSFLLGNGNWNISFMLQQHWSL